MSSPTRQRPTDRRALEDERRRIARAIHDSVTQEIAVVIWQLRMACNTHSQENTQTLRALEVAESAMGHLRALMHGLRSQNRARAVTQTDPPDAG
jgi:signal transduction histidine kinase